MSRLRYLDDTGVLQVRAIGREKFIIGRVEGCQLTIVDDLVSREHARLDRDPDGRYRVRDLGSRNKTYVNGQLITETLLTHGDLIRIGGRVMEFLDEARHAEPIDEGYLTPDRSDPAGTEWVKIKEPLALTAEQCGVLATLGSEATFLARTEEVASAVLGALMVSLGADRGFVALRGESRKELQPLVHRGLAKVPGAAGVTPVSRTFVYSSFLQSVAGRYPQKAGDIDARAGYASAGLVAPVLQKREVVGVLYVDRPTAAQVFGPEAVSMVAAAGAHLGALITDAAQKLASTESRTAAGWLTTLRRAQSRMSSAPVSSEAFELGVRLINGRGRCGDFYDVIHVDEGRVVALTADAGGQGLAGFGHAAAIRAAVRTALTVEGGVRDISAVMSALNRALAASASRQLVTCTLADIDLSDGHVHYINAGGPPPLMLVGPGRLVTLDQPSLVLGIDENYSYETTSLDLPSSFRLMMHTDGLSEMINAAGEAIGSQAIHDLLLERESFTNAAAIISQIVEACDRHRGAHPPDDDALILIVSHG